MNFPNETIWKLSADEMSRYTEGADRSTLIITVELLLLLPKDTLLLPCLVITEETTSEAMLCGSYNVILPERCDSCSSNAPGLIEDFQEVCIRCDCAASPINDAFEFYSKLNVH